MNAHSLCILWRHAQRQDAAYQCLVAAVSHALFMSPCWAVCVALCVCGLVCAQAALPGYRCPVDVHVIVAPVFATNCCLVVEGHGEPGAHVVIVDAGGGVADAVIQMVEERGWLPQAVLATHGHADHIWDARPICERYGIPLRIHVDDVYRLSDPLGTLDGHTSQGQAQGQVQAHGPVAAAMEQGLVACGCRVEDYQVPSQVQPFDALGDDGNGMLIAGNITVRVVHAPGHTQGAVVYVTDDIALTGDVVFAGTVGRTDLPGGDPKAMRKTLQRLHEVLDVSLGVVPGHGPATTLKREIESNPYFQ